MAVSEEYRLYILNQLNAFGNVEEKRMFGGVGLFRDGLMFGKIGGKTLYFKVDDDNRAAYEEAGMKAFHSASKKKGMPYWEVPVDVIKDAKELAKWAEDAYQAAIRAKK